MSDDRLNRSRAGVVVVIPITSTRRGLPSHVELEPGTTGLAVTSYAKGEDLKSVSTERLAHRLGTVPAEQLEQAQRAIRMLLGL